MAYDTNLADRVREYLAEIPEIDVEEMLRFDPSRQEELYEKDGYETMLMKGKEYKGYCYINPDGFKDRKDFEFFLNICLEYNKIAKSSKKRKTK